MSATLSPEQLEAVRRWASEGVDLNGIQKKLAAECGLHMTFMEVRFLLLDHGIEISAPAEKNNAPKDAPTPESSAPAADGGKRRAEDDAAGREARLQVTLDDLQIPGTLLSGKATFPSGICGSWQIDQAGRFGWSELTGTPSPAELQDFQYELTQLLSRA